MNEPVYLNDFCQNCGYFNSNTIVNDGYGCDHPNQEYTEIIKISKPERRPDGLLFRAKIVKVFLRKKYGSFRKIKEALKTKNGQAFLHKCRTEFIHDPDKLKKIGLKIQGKCYSFSCPISNQFQHDWDYVIPFN